MSREDTRAFKAVQASTATHEMTILHDHDNYRHLRFRKPGTGIWGFDIITWPGSLTIRGDIGRGFTFTRTENMLEFFDKPFGYVNAQYWSEKLERTCRDSAESFNERAFLGQGIKHIIEHWDLTPKDRHKAITQFKEALEYEGTEEQQFHAVDGFRFTDSDGQTHEFYDVWDWDYRQWDFHFLIALHAIVWAVNRYKSENTS